MSELNNLGAPQDDQALDNASAQPVRRSKTRYVAPKKEERRPGTQRDIEAQKKVDVKAAKKKRSSAAGGPKVSPSWWAPVMCTLMILGLVCVVVAYISGGNLPIPGFQNGNLFIGFALMIVGFLMTMGWH